MLQLLATRRRLLPGLIAVLAIGSLGIWGCADHPTEYDNPADGIVTTLTPNALIDAATLAGWIDEGRLNSTDPDSRDKVVILTVATAANYAISHIPGAQLLNSSTELSMTRFDALATVGTELLDGPSMDALVQRCGIDEHTTIVFSVSTGQNLLNASRAYFTFRYWGFPKERLKYLQGGDAGWTAAAYTLTGVDDAAAPVVARSDFSVREFYKGNFDNFGVRTSLGEMISTVDKVNTGTLSVADGAGTIEILDTRGGINVETGVYVNNAKIDNYADYFVSGATSTFKPTEDLVARLSGLGVTAEKSMIYTYCASGVRASAVFFVLDGILGWPVTIYDGSTGQWMGYTTANGVNAAWRVDVTTPGTLLARTYGTPAGSLTVDAVSNALYTSIADTRANQILNEDQAYFSSGGATTPPPGGGGGGGGGGSGC
jgi:3-mercaptopyruvate sulfurtransferase SseA